MNIEIIKSDSVCDYCKNKYDFNYTGHSCNYWYTNKHCENNEDFEGKELIEVSE